MAVSISGTTLTFNDGTTQTTARTSSNTVTSVAAGSGISVSGSTGAVTISATGGGTVTSVATGNGLTGGTITSSGTISLDYYTGSNATQSSLPIGSYILVASTVNATQANNINSPTLNNSRALYVTTGGTFGGSPYEYVMGSGSGVSVSALSGTWVRRGSGNMTYCSCAGGLQAGAPHLFQRIS